MKKTLFLIEDDPIDIKHIKESFNNHNNLYNLYWATNGEDALNKLKSKNFIRPSLIILDLYMPKIDGWEILNYLKSGPSMRSIPVVILTVSENQSDVIKAYKNMANCYIVKPSDPGQFKSLLQSLCRFWFETVKLPEF